MSKGSGTKMVESTSGPTKEYATFGKENLSLAAGLANRPYIPYTGERLAQFGQGENAAFDTINGMAGGSGSVNLGWDTANRLSNANTPQLSGQAIMASAQDFMNPYTQQVVDASMNDLAKANQRALGQVGGNAVGAGGFGGSRHGVAQALTNSEFMDTAARTAAGLRSAGFTDAVNNAMTMGQTNQAATAADLNRQLQAAGAMRAAGNDMFNRDLSLASAQQEIGAMQRDREQAALDLQYGDFLEQQAHPERMLGIRQSALGMTPLSQVSRTPVQRSGLNFGSLAQGAGSLLMGAAKAGLIGSCWVAREVYGVDNPRWLVFREWMLNEAPAWFRKLYLKHGEKFADYISDKPTLKRVIRAAMDAVVNRKLKGVEHGFAV